MAVAIWILMWLFAFIVAVEIFGRRYYGLYPPVKAARGWLTIYLSDTADIARGQLEYYLSWVEWNGAGHNIVFVREEHVHEIPPMFERYFEGLPCVKLTTKSELPRLLAGQY